MSTISERIVQARKMRNLSQDKLAERMKVSRGACGHWERGKASPSTKHLALLAQILNVSLEWLAIGKGEPDSIAQISESAKPKYSLPFDDETREVAELYYRLSKRKRQTILNLLREL